MSNSTFRLNLEGLAMGPPQGAGAVRLVPVLRSRPPGDLRMAIRDYGPEPAIVNLRGEFKSSGPKYMSYIPHGLVLRWSDDGLPVAAFGAELRTRRSAKTGGVKLHHRMVKREDRLSLRILPLHLAMEGFLSLHFGGPDIAWSEYSQQALRRGLDPRLETSVAGVWLPDLREALRSFELHQGQVGSLVFVADALASAFVVSHPEDYRKLHTSLLEDFFGELLLRYALQHPHPTRLEAHIDERRVESLDDLERALERVREEWAAFGAQMAEGLFERDLEAELVRHAGPFRLRRFMTDLDPALENHIGEGIFRDGGQVEYLKTYRLSAAQTRRAHLLRRLAAHHWNLEATAWAEGQSLADLTLRIEKAGFGYLLKEELRSALRRGR